jgi:predicted transcriptional regulator
MACILDKANSKAKKTHIMYSCNLSFKQFQVYLDLLIESGLIDLQKAEESEVEILKTTNDGRSFLEAYRKLKTFLAST